MNDATSNMICVDKQVLLSQRRAYIIIDPKKAFSDKHMVSALNGIVKFRPEVPLQMLVAKFANQPTWLHKCHVIAHAFYHHAFISKKEVTLAEVINIQFKPTKPAQNNPPIGAEQDTSILTHSLKSKSAFDILLNGFDNK